MPVVRHGVRPRSIVRARAGLLVGARGGACAAHRQDLRVGAGAAVPSHGGHCRAEGHPCRPPASGAVYGARGDAWRSHHLATDGHPRSRRSARSSRQRGRCAYPQPPVERVSEHCRTATAAVRAVGRHVAFIDRRRGRPGKDRRVHRRAREWSREPSGLGCAAVTVRVTTLKGADAGVYYVEALPSYYLEADEPPGRWLGAGARSSALPETWSTKSFWR